MEVKTQKILIIKRKELEKKLELGSIESIIMDYAKDEIRITMR